MSRSPLHAHRCPRPHEVERWSINLSPRVQRGYFRLSGISVYDADRIVCVQQSEAKAHQAIKSAIYKIFVARREPPKSWITFLKGYALQLAAIAGVKGAAAVKMGDYALSTLRKHRKAFWDHTVRVCVGIVMYSYPAHARNLADYVERV